MDRGSQLDEEEEKEDEKREEKEEDEDEEDEEEATDIKSNNPHLAGGEKTWTSPCFAGVQHGDFHAFTTITTAGFWLRFFGPSGENGSWDSCGRIAPSPWFWRLAWLSRGDLNSMAGVTKHGWEMLHRKIMENHRRCSKIRFFCS